MNHQSLPMGVRTKKHTGILCSPSVGKLWNRLEPKANFFKRILPSSAGRALSLQAADEVGTRKCFKVPTCCPCLLLPKNNSLIFNSARQAGTDLNPFPFSCKDLIKNYETMKVWQVGKCSHLNVHSVLCYHTTLRPKSKFRLIKCLGVNLLISLWLLKSLQAVYTKTGWMSQVAFNRDIWCQQKCLVRKKRHFWERCFSCYFNMSPKTV